MDVAEFYQWVRDTANRGTTLDVSIPHYIKAAVREIENKRNWERLDYWAKFSLATTDDPVIALPSRLKQVDFLRYNIAEAGKRPKWEYVTKSTAPFTVSRTGDPKLYWQKGRELLLLDAKLAESRDFELKVFRYSEFPDEDAGSGVQHWLLDSIPMALHSKVMLGMSGFIREDLAHMIQLWSNLYGEGIRDLIEEDDMAKEAGIEPEMVFWPDHIPYADAFTDEEDS